VFGVASFTIESAKRTNAFLDTTPNPRTARSSSRIERCAWGMTPLSRLSSAVAS
jgi:hypothetical protein